MLMQAAKLAGCGQRNDAEPLPVGKFWTPRNFGVKECGWRFSRAGQFRRFFARVGLEKGGMLTSFR
jgi:hypothetical protein